MAVKIADKIVCMNNQDYVLMDASAVEYTKKDGTVVRVDEFLDNISAGGGSGASIDDTQASDTTTYSSNKIEADYQKKTDDTLTTTDKTIVGSINEVNGNLLDTVVFSADYKNIILNRKNGLNPYTIPISAIINNASLAELKDIDSTDIGNGKILVYDGDTNKHKYVDSSITDELVKMDSATDAKYLSDLIDKSTVVNDNGVLKVKKLDGQEVTITEINYLKGLTMNVTDLVNAFSNGGVKVLNTPVATYADLTTLDRSAFIEGISYIVYVLADETHAGAKTTYLCDKTSSTYFGNADSQRNFTTNPIDLANEVTGKLGTSNIDVDNLWALLTINDTYKTLTTTDNVFGTHGAKAMYDELTTSIGEKANATDLTTHTGNTDIHITTTERTKWNDTADKVDGAELVKKADIVTTTLDENATNDDIYGGRAIYDAIKANYVGKETVLFKGAINTTGTYTLADDVNIYDFIVINHCDEDNLKQSVVLTKNEINTCIDTNSSFTCVKAKGSINLEINGYFNRDKIVISKCLKQNITSIVGYKFGQITVANTITNPAVGKSYSTDEQLTGGTWIDGKPIYRKTVACGALPNNDGKDTPHGIANIDKVIDTYGIAFDNSGINVSLPFADASSGGSISAYRNGAIIRITTAKDRTLFTESYVTLEYTKTTDA